MRRGAGGGIYNRLGTARVTNSTFANNGAADGAAVYKFAGQLTLKNTILANSPSDGNCGGIGPIFDLGHNLDSGGRCRFRLSRGSFSNLDPKLDPAGPANNGGATQTIAVQAGSPAINAGSPSACRAAAAKNLDQRGFVRPGTGSTTCTIGAYEFNSPGPRTR